MDEDDLIEARLLLGWSASLDGPDRKPYAMWRSEEGETMIRTDGEATIANGGGDSLLDRAFVEGGPTLREIADPIGRGELIFLDQLTLDDELPSAT